MKILSTLICFIIFLSATTLSYAIDDPNQITDPITPTQTEEVNAEEDAPESITEEERLPNQPLDIEALYSILDDRTLLEGYSTKYNELSKVILLEMIKDDTLGEYKSAAAVRTLRNNFGEEIVSKEKKIVEKILLRRLNRTNSPFVQVEIFYTLNVLDRFRYFKSMTPALIQKLNHYNEAVNELAFEYLTEITTTSNYRAREARIVFNTLRKVMFLSRKRLSEVTTPTPQLARKLKILRWSIKALGSQQLKKLPKEVLGLL